MGDTFEYGYFVRGKRVVLGSVGRLRYSEKAKEIQDANFVSRSVTGMSLDSTIWFIAPLTQDESPHDPAASG